MCDEDECTVERDKFKHTRKELSLNIVAAKKKCWTDLLGQRGRQGYLGSLVPPSHEATGEAKIDHRH